MKAFTNAVGLRVFDLGFGVVDIVDGQEQLIVVFVRPAAELRASIRQDAQHRQAVFFIERQDLIIEQIG